MRLLFFSVQYFFLVKWKSLIFFFSNPQLKCLKPGVSMHYAYFYDRAMLCVSFSWFMVTRIKKSFRTTGLNCTILYNDNDPQDRSFCGYYVTKYVRNWKNFKSEFFKWISTSWSANKNWVAKVTFFTNFLNNKKLTKLVEKDRILYIIQRTPRLHTNIIAFFFL